MKGPPDILYSTRPKIALAKDGFRYVLKGPDPGVVFAEATAYELANVVGLPVPSHGACNPPDSSETFFACRELKVRSAIDGLIQRGRTINPEVVPHVVAFDTWIANTDRNVGNIVGDPYSTNGTGSIKLYAIDFEKAETMRGNMDRFSVTAIEVHRFWPTGDLGALCRTYAPPTEFCRRISEVRRSEIEGVLNRVIWGLNFPEIGWIPAAIDLLAQRAERIESFIQELWNE